MIVPANSQVIVDGVKTTSTGTSREFVSPPLTPGKTYLYTIDVRTTNSEGKVVDEVRKVQVRANDWWTVDFTKPVLGTTPTSTSAAP
jgi:uncharacterized protein (TIGR03000 family)